MKSIRKGPWKYIPQGHVTSRTRTGTFSKDRISGVGALYYLPEDPHELNDLARQYPEKARELSKLLERELSGTSSKDSAADELGGAVQN